jgi:COMPASS component SWD1
LWDLKDGSRVRTVILGGPIWSADLHPKDQYAPWTHFSNGSLRFVASVLETDPVLVDLHGTSAKRHVLPTTLPTLSTTEDDAADITKTQYTLVAVFDRSGKYIYSGTSRGFFNVIDADSCEVVPSKSSLTQLVGKIVSFVQRCNQTYPILLSRKNYLCQLCRSSCSYHSDSPRSKFLHHKSQG